MYFIYRVKYFFILYDDSDIYYYLIGNNNILFFFCVFIYLIFKDIKIFIIVIFLMYKLCLS